MNKNKIKQNIKLEIVNIKKIKELNNVHDTTKYKKNYSTSGFFYKPPKIGNSFFIGTFCTSIVTKIIDNNTFETLNSIYYWKKSKFKNHKKQKD